jgi:hypothetical protein
MKFDCLRMAKWPHSKQKGENMRKIIASEFMTIDGVIQNEEADGDGFK